MNAIGSNLDEQLRHALRLELLGLASHEEEIAAAEAVPVRYWEPMPLSVASHRQCASVLRGLADQVDATAPLHGRQLTATHGVRP